MAIRLLLCVLIFAAAVIIKAVFPVFAASSASKVIEVISGDVDYKAAAVSIANAVTGKEDAAEALGEAWRYAFGLTDPGGDSELPANE